MVTIVDCVNRTSNEGSEFVALIVQSELELVTSKNGNIYAAAHRASIPCTLDMETAKMLIGKTLPGFIEKVECEPYETANSDGELIVLNHRYSYVPEEIRTVVPEKNFVSLEELEPETV